MENLKNWETIPRNLQIYLRAYQYSAWYHSNIGPSRKWIKNVWGRSLGRYGCSVGSSPQHIWNCQGTQKSCMPQRQVQVLRRPVTWERAWYKLVTDFKALRPNHIQISSPMILSKMFRLQYEPHVKLHDIEMSRDKWNQPHYNTEKHGTEEEEYVSSGPFPWLFSKAFYPGTI